MAVRCLVAHEAEYMRLLMSDILVKNGFEVAGRAATGTEAVDMYEALRPDILTLDFRLPELDGIEALREIIRRDPRARVVIFSSMGEQTHVID
ncbi:MAG: response regulator, partial [Candidatus Sericytochromatia bacterium]